MTKISKTKHITRTGVVKRNPVQGELTPAKRKWTEEYSELKLSVNIDNARSNIERTNGVKLRNSPEYTRRYLNKLTKQMIKKLYIIK